VINPALTALTNFPAKQFQSMTNQLKTHVAGNSFFQSFQFFMLEFVNFTAIDINQVFMMVTRHFIACLAITDFELFDHAHFFEDTDRAVDRGQ